MLAAEGIVAREGVEGLLSYTARAVMAARQKRANGIHPTPQKADVSFVSEVRREKGLIEERKREMGWQVYGTNGLALALTQVVWAYRGQYRIEDDWSRLKGAVAGPDAAVLAGRGPHPGTGVPVECRVACAESGGVGGTRAIAKGEDEV